MSSLPNKCIFCDSDLDPGSAEHVFPSSIGGRLETRNAICLACNNHFAAVSGEEVDGAVADAFIAPRCALNIWTGRGKPPPTIYRAGSLPDGTEYDLGP